MTVALPFPPASAHASTAGKERREIEIKSHCAKTGGQGGDHHAQEKEYSNADNILWRGRAVLRAEMARQSRNVPLPVLDRVLVLEHPLMQALMACSMR